MLIVFIMLIVFALAQKIKEKGSVFNLKVCVQFSLRVYKLVF